MSARPLRRPVVPEAEPEERRGLMLSAGAHVAIVLLAIFGGPLFKGDEAQAVRMADVDLITSSQFDAMISQAPEGPRGEVASLVPPKPGKDSPTAEAKQDKAPARKDPAKAESAPSPAKPPAKQEPAAPTETAKPAARPEAPKAPDAPVTPRKGVETSSPALPAGPKNLDAPQREAPVVPDAAPPRKIDRVAPTPAPPKQTIAEADKPTQAKKPTDQPAPTPPTPDKPAAAPKEAASQIVTEADKTSEKDTLAPTASAPPSGRPDAAETKTAAVEPTPEKPVEKPAEKAAEKPAEKPAEKSADKAPAKPADKPAQKPADSTSAKADASKTASSSGGATTNAPLGPALTSGQIEGVKLGIQKYWNISRVAGLPNYEELIVKVQVRLDQSGKMVGKPEVVSPKGAADPRWRVAIQAAEIAVTRAASTGFKLPAESYGRWQLIELTFNPGKGVQF